MGRAFFPLGSLRSLRVCALHGLARSGSTAGVCSVQLSVLWFDAKCFFLPNMDLVADAPIALMLALPDELSPTDRYAALLECTLCHCNTLCCFCWDAASICVLCVCCHPSSLPGLLFPTPLEPKEHRRRNMQCLYLYRESLKSLRT